MKKLLALLLIVPILAFGQTIQFKSANVKITGGAIDGTTVGSTTPAAVAATTISGTTGLFSTANSGQLTINSTNSNGSTLLIQEGGVTKAGIGHFTQVGNVIEFSIDGSTQKAVLNSTGLSVTGGVSGTTLTSTVATGTAPLVIASTTQVANLNAATAGTATNLSGGSVSGTTGAFSGAITLPGLASSSAATTGTLCWTTGTGNVNVDTTTTCLLSARKYKQDIVGLGRAMPTVLALRPVSYQLRPEFNPDKLGRQVGFIADEVQKVDPRFVSFDSDGEAHAVRYQQMTALLVKAVQEQQKQINALKKQINAKIKQ